MADTLKPENDVQLLDAIKWAISEKTPLEAVSYTHLTLPTICSV